MKHNNKQYQSSKNSVRRVSVQMPAVLDEKGEQVLLEVDKGDPENSFLFRSIPTSDIELRVLKVDDDDSVDDEQVAPLPLPVS